MGAMQVEAIETSSSGSILRKNKERESVTKRLGERESQGRR